MMVLATNKVLLLTLAFGLASCSKVAQPTCVQISDTKVVSDILGAAKRIASNEESMKNFVLEFDENRIPRDCHDYYEVRATEVSSGTPKSGVMFLVPQTLSFLLLQIGDDPLTIRREMAP